MKNTRFADALASLRQTTHELGRINGLLYILHRLLSRSTGGRIRLVRYLVVAQPLGQASAMRVRSSGSTAVEDVGPGHLWCSDFPRPPAVIAARFSQGARCLAAQVSGNFAGYLWWQRNRYDEDEVRCRFMMTQPTVSAWDFDVYVEPRYRLGRTLALLWMGAEQRMLDEGVRWSFSRISGFNAESLAAHARLGAAAVAHALFLVVGPLQLAVFNCRPFIHLSLGRASAPTLSVSPPTPITARSARK